MKLYPMAAVDLLPHLPVDLSLSRNTGGGVAFTPANPGAYGGQAPIYRDPSHLAAWFAGYLAGQATTEKGLN